jgi:hypothetical protein
MTDDARPAPGSADAAIRLDRWTVTSGSNANSRAAVVIHAGDHDWKASAEGNGGVDALFKAVDRALAPILGGSPALLAYDVHALAEGPDAEGEVTIAIAPPASASGDRASGRFDGRVRSTNTIAASIEAYVDALNAMLRETAWADSVVTGAGRRPWRASDDVAAPTEYEADDSHIDATEWFNR